MHIPREMVEVNSRKLHNAMAFLAMEGVVFHSREEALDFILDLFISNYLASKELENKEKR